MELYRYVPELQPVFDQTIANIKAAEHKSHLQLAASLQRRLEDPALLRLESTPMIGNPLRTDITTESDRLHKEIEEITLPLRQKMLKLIELPDNDLRR